MSRLHRNPAPGLSHCVFRIKPASRSFLSSFFLLPSGPAPPLEINNAPHHHHRDLVFALSLTHERWMTPSETVKLYHPADINRLLPEAAQEKSRGIILTTIITSPVSPPLYTSLHETLISKKSAPLTFLSPHWCMIARVALSSGCHLSFS